MDHKELILATLILARHRLKPIYFLALLPVAAFFSGGLLADFAPTLVLGMPFLMVWNVSWLLATSCIMMIIDRHDGDLDHGAGGAHGEPR